jgi:hypothetical protein
MYRVIMDVESVTLHLDQKRLAAVLQKVRGIFDLHVLLVATNFYRGFGPPSRGA